MSSRVGFSPFPILTTFGHICSCGLTYPTDCKMLYTHNWEKAILTHLVLVNGALKLKSYKL